MFKSKKSRTEKIKFNAVFQLHFQASRVPELKRSSGLTVSLVPENVRKPTVTLPKVTINDGICTWETPIYETVHLTAENGNGKVDKKIYFFVVSSGPSKSGFLGEVSIDFAEYLEATTPWLVPLPLTGSESGPMLNVTIQRMPADDKMFLKKDGVTPKLDSLDRNCDNSSKDHSCLKLDSKDETSCSKNAVSSRATMAAEHVPSTRLESSVADWSVDSFSDQNMSDSMNSPEYNYTNEALSEQLNSFSDKPKSEGITTTRQVQLLELDLQALRKQVAKETKKSQELSAKVVKLKEERDMFESEREKLKSFHSVSDLQQENEVSTSNVEELRKELNKEKYASKKLRSQLHIAQDSNSELILVVRDLKKMLNQCKVDSSKKETGSSADLDEEQTVLKESENVKELQSLKQKLEELYGEMDLVRNEKEEAENDLQQLSMENRRLRKENRDISSQLEKQKIQHWKMEKECTEVISHLEDLESHVGMLRIENKKQAEALSESWDTITELEAHINSLEKEFEAQKKKYKEELEAVMCEKDVLEKRAIQGEETLRKSKENNAATAEKKMVVEAQRDIDEITAEKHVIEENFVLHNHELCFVKTQYQEQLQKLQNQIDEKDKLIEKLSLELRAKSHEFENTGKLNNLKVEAFSMQIGMLKGDIERLSNENNNYTEQAKLIRTLRDEMEYMRKTISDNEILKETWNAERSQLEERLHTANVQAEKFQEELNAISRLKDQKEKMISYLSSQKEKLNVEIEEMKNNLSKEKLDRQDLKLKVSQLKDELRKKEEAVLAVEQKLKETRTRNNASVAANGVSKNNKSVMNLQASQEVSSLKKKVKTLEEQIKAKDAVIGNTASSYKEKEKQLRCKIKELESKAKKLPSREKESKGTGTILANSSGARSPAGKSSPKAKVLAAQPTQGDSKILEEMRVEMALLKEKNKSMEFDLKDMEERYSEISLKFAEVESERQELVMTVRNLKNGKRG